MVGKSTNTRPTWYRWWPAIVVSLAAIVASPWLLGPRCPTHLVIATGPADGAYSKFALKYREILAESGINLEIRHTAGSVENQELLGTESSSIDLAIVQGGIGNEKTSQIQALASLYQEPVWIFHRVNIKVQTLTDLKGLRVAVGPKGSGVRSIAMDLLADNQIEEGQANTKLLGIGTTEAAGQLKAGRIDAAFFVISPESIIIQDLLVDDRIQLASFDRAAAYQRRHPFLSRAVLPEGVADFRRNKPNRDVQLLAPTANLVANPNIHHAIVPLLLQAVERVHNNDGMLVQANTFPTTRFTDYELNPAAARYFNSGPSLLYRYFPFWMAAWLDRVKLILLPLCTLLIPLLKFAPPVYRWRIRSRIYRWYRVLREIDLQLENASGHLDSTEYLTRLNELEGELFDVSVPLSYMEEFYNLRIHVALVKTKLHKADKPIQIRKAA